jgi:serine/threonine protein kinase
MSESGPDRLRALFDAALDLEPGARDAFLRARCGGDDALRQKVQRLLDGAEADDFLASPTTGLRGAAAAADAAVLQEGTGSRIGPYLLVEKLGEGGFGVVFLAEQQQPVARQVALKIVKLGMDTRQVVARFEQERQALAMMDHPNIAKVFDAGATATGRPYFVMELVAGAPMVAFCDGEQLNVRERLELFVQVCRAVQHAHGKGVIHRDLKPSNVLVARQDGRPVAKVIDFGVAKATSRRSDAAMLTEEQQVLGTLQYMSPEQAAGADNVDTRTDVWALGVLLYELLTGSTPFGRQQIAAAMVGELQRLLREVDPPKPSTRLHQSTANLAKIAAQRRSEPRRLGSLLRGDLDWIVMKALEKDRQRRYATVDGFAADVERHLVGEPVQAAPPSASYRLVKALRRHRGAFTAAGLVLGALLIGVVGFAWQANVAAGERDVAVQAQRAEAKQRAEADRLATAEAQQRERAQKNEAKATAINRFLLDMLGAADVRQLGRTATVAQALDRAAAKVGSSFAEQPEVAAAIHQALAKAYLSLGLLDAARPQIDAALIASRTLHGEASAEHVRALLERGELERLLDKRGDSLATYTLALELAQRIVPADRELVLDVQLVQANSLRAVDRLEEAEKAFRTVLPALLQAYGEDHVQTVIARNSLAVLLQRTRRYDEAEALYRESLAIARRRFGDDHVDALVAEMNLAGLLRDLGKETEAAPMFESTYRRLRAAYGDDHARTGEAAWRLGVMYFDYAKNREALPLFEECLRIRVATQGNDTIEVAEAHEKIGHLVGRLGDHERSLRELTTNRAIRERLLGPDARHTLEARLHVANALVRASRQAEAEGELRATLARCEEVLGEDAPTTAVATNSYAVLLMSLLRYADAVPHLQKALARGRKATNLDDRDTLITQLNLCMALRESAQLDEALALVQDAMPRLVRAFGVDHNVTGAGHQAHGDTLAARGTFAEAVGAYTEALRIARLGSRPDDPAFAFEALALARAHVETAAFADAETLLGEVADVYAKKHGDKSRFVLGAAAERARIAWKQGRWAEAEAQLLATEQGLAALVPPNRRELPRTRRYVAAFYAEWNTAEPSPQRAEQAAAWAAKAAAPR